MKKFFGKMVQNRIKWIYIPNLFVGSAMVVASILGSPMYGILLFITLVLSLLEGFIRKAKKVKQ